MKITLTSTLTNFSYTAPIIVGPKTISENKILAVKIFGDNQFISQIDFTALSHFHHYTIDQWQKTLVDFFSTYLINFDEIKLDSPYFNMISDVQKAPIFNGELLTIIESVLFSLIEKLNPARLPTLESPIKINGLYSKELTANNSNCLKIKIRPNLVSLQETVLIIKDILEKSPESIFRLDGNRTFELRELLNFMGQLEDQLGESLLKEKIEYIEEPFKNSYDFFTFKNIYHYNEAMDESLLNYSDKLSLLIKKAPNFLILKPSLLGLSKSFEIMKLFPKKCIISSSYECASAIRPLLYLSALNPHAYHGFDTLKYLPKELSIVYENYSIIL